MPLKESHRSLRIRWSPRPADEEIEARKKSLGEAQHVSVSYYADRVCVTATYSDRKTRNVARNLLIKTPGGATVDLLFDDVTVMRSPENPDLDICAVHGLEGNAADSFTSKSNLWLRDLLPNQPFAKAARISTFGYNSRLFDGNVTDRLQDWAEYLLQAVCSIRTSTGTAGLPMIFVCHSMGGLVARKAIEHLFEYPHDSKYTGLALDRCAILFLSTPHKGTVEADYNDFMTEVLKSTFRMRKDDIIGELKSFNSSAAQAIRKWNRMRERQVAPPLACLTESKKTQITSFKSVLLVTQVSASFGGGVADKIPNTDHHEVCKFENAFCAGYAMVVKRLEDLVKELSTPRVDLLSIDKEEVLSRNSSPGSSMFEEVRDGSKNQQRNVRWVVYLSLNSLFTGREDALRRVEHDLLKETANSSLQRRYVITGVDGQGKSELCLKLIFEMRHRFGGVFWVDVSSPASAALGFHNIATRLGRRTDILEEGRQLVANLQHNWILVLVNANDPETDYFDYIPSGGLGTILITSHNDECTRYSTIGSHRLECLAAIDAQILLMKAAKIPEEQKRQHLPDAQQVAKILKYHPLALIQAGVYLAASHSTLSQYPPIHRQQGQLLLKFRSVQEGFRYAHVYAALEASAQLMGSSQEVAARDALDLLCSMSMMSHLGLSSAIFEAAWRGARRVITRGNSDDANNVERLLPWHVRQLVPFLQPERQTWDSNRLIQARQLLESLSLITMQGSVILLIHPLTHQWARDRQDRSLQIRYWVSTGSVIALSIFGSDIWRERIRHLKSHLYAWLDKDAEQLRSSGPPAKINQMLYQGALILMTIPDDSKLLAVLDRICQVFSMDTDKIERHQLPLYKLTARARNGVRHVKKAITIWKHIVELETKLLEDHADRLASQYTLALAYRANGQTKDAIKLLEHVVQIRKGQDQLSSQLVLAEVFQENGQVQEAIKLLEDVVELGKTLPEDHPSRLKSLESLAKAYNTAGQLYDAIRLWKRVVAIRAKDGDEDHDRLLAQQSLARLQLMAGQTQAAIALLNHVLAMRAKSLPENHINCLTPQHELARAHERAGQVKEAIQLMNHVLELGKGSLRKDHPFLPSAERWLRKWRSEYGL